MRRYRILHLALRVGHLCDFPSEKLLELKDGTVTPHGDCELGPRVILLSSREVDRDFIEQFTLRQG